MTDEAKKPSEQIDEWAQEYLHRHVPLARDPSQNELQEARVYLRILIEHLDSEHARRAEWEREVEERIAQLERKTSSTEDERSIEFSTGFAGVKSATTPPVVITTVEEWRGYHGDYPPPPHVLTDPRPVTITMYEPSEVNPSKARSMVKP